MRGLLAYLAVGLICHLLFIGAHLDPASAWTWLWLIGWPVMLFAYFWGALLAIVLAIILLCALAAALRLV